MFLENQDLPPVLDSSIINAYIKEYQETGNIQARNKVVEHNLRIVRSQVKPFCKYGYYDEEELASVGTVALIRSIDDYDVSIGTKFSTVATKYICTAIRKFVQNQKKYRLTESLENVIFESNDGVDITLADNLHDSHVDFVADYEKKEWAMELRAAIENLSDKGKEVIISKYGFKTGIPLTDEEIAKQQGCTAANVGDIKRRNIVALRKFLINQGIIDKSCIKKKVKV